MWYFDLVARTELSTVQASNTQGSYTQVAEVYERQDLVERHVTMIQILVALFALILQLEKRLLGYVQIEAKMMSG